MYTLGKRTERQSNTLVHTGALAPNGLTAIASLAVLIALEDEFPIPRPM